MRIMSSVFVLSLANTGHASVLSLPSFIDEPAHCFQQQKFPCAMRVLKAGANLHLAQLNFFADQGASFVLVQPYKVRLLQGLVLVDSQVEVQVELSAVNISGRGEFLLEAQADAKILLTNLLGELKVSGVQSALQESLPVGFTKWYAGLNQLGQLEQGILTPIDPASAIRRWRDLTLLPKILAKQKIQLFQSAWKQRIEISTQLYQAVASRRIASQEERIRRLEKRLADERQERKFLHQLFRTRNFLE